MSSYNVLPKQKHLPTILIDFDGVIHSYENGWQSGEIYGTIVPGFVEWYIEAKRHFTLAIYSSRSAEGHKGIKPMQDWLAVNLKAYGWEHPTVDPADLTINSFQWPTQKPAAYITIDDRCICFNGNWKEDALQPERLKDFKPWNMKGNLAP